MCDDGQHDVKSRRIFDTCCDHGAARLLHQHGRRQNAGTSASESWAWVREREGIFAQGEKEPVWGY